MPKLPSMIRGGVAVLVASATLGLGPCRVGHNGPAVELCYEEIDRFRAITGQTPLARWLDGEECAAVQAKSDHESGFFHGRFGNCAEQWQNECLDWEGWESPSVAIGTCLQNMFDEGPPSRGAINHYSVMTDPSHNEVACGIYVSPSGVVNSVQNYR